jgi:hypothetical protein
VYPETIFKPADGQTVDKKSWAGRALLKGETLTMSNYSQTNQVCGKARGRRAAELAPGQ